jgi:hypothetical protein
MPSSKTAASSTLSTLTVPQRQALARATAAAAQFRLAKPWGYGSRRGERGSRFAGLPLPRAETSPDRQMEYIRCEPRPTAEIRFPKRISDIPRLPSTSWENVRLSLDCPPAPTSCIRAASASTFRGSAHAHPRAGRPSCRSRARLRRRTSPAWLRVAWPYLEPRSGRRGGDQRVVPHRSPRGPWFRPRADVRAVALHWPANTLRPLSRDRRSPRCHRALARRSLKVPLLGRPALVVSLVLALAGCGGGYPP